MDTTERVLVSMLTENTGKSLLDSGGNMGRHWQRNQYRHFTKEPSAEVDFDYSYIRVEINLFHFLRDKVIFHSELNKLFKKFSAKAGKDKSWLCLMEEFVDKLQEMDVVGESFSVNSYNLENMLNQGIQYIYFNVTKPFKLYGVDIPVGRYSLVQIHNGADVRGGYTAPRAFACDDEYSIMRFSNATISCSEDHDHVWYTDDSSHWYANVGDTNLEKYEWLSIENKDGWREGLLCVDEKGVGYCPVCGGILKAYF